MNDEFGAVDETGTGTDNCTDFECADATEWLLNIAIKIGIACVVKLIFQAFEH